MEKDQGRYIEPESHPDSSDSTDSAREINALGQDSSPLYVDQSPICTNTRASNLMKIGKSPTRVLAKRKSLHRGYTDMVAGPERTKMVFEHMFNKMGTKQIKQTYVEEKAVQVKKRN